MDIADALRINQKLWSMGLHPRIVGLHNDYVEVKNMEKARAYRLADELHEFGYKVAVVITSDGYTVEVK